MILMASRMICHGAVSRCMIAGVRADNGRSCSVCRARTLSGAVTGPICGSAEFRKFAGKPAAEAVQCFAGLQDRADRQHILDHIGRTDAGQRARLVAAAHRRGNLEDRIRRGELEFADRSLKTGRRSGFPHQGQRRFEFARLVGRAVADQPLPHRQQRRAADLTRPYRKIAVDEKRFEWAERQPRGSSVRGRTSSSLPRTTLHATVRARVATVVSSPRSMARSNSRISKACACGGSCAR